MTQFQIDQIESYVKKRTENLSPVHGYEHLRRTAIGAKWFANHFGETEEIQNVSYLAGLIHDLERPNSEKIDHKDISIREAKKVLFDFNVDQKDQELVLQQISEHREFESDSLSSQYVFLSDKILEQSGAYVIFRRFYYIGECEDYQGGDFYDSAYDHWTYRMKKFSPNKYPKQVRSLAESQFEWQVKYFEALENKQDWAMEIAETFFNHGRLGRKDLRELIGDHKAINETDAKFKEEALEYIDGKSFQYLKRWLP